MAIRYPYNPQQTQSGVYGAPPMQPNAYGVPPTHSNVYGAPPMQPAYGDQQSQSRAHSRREVDELTEITAKTLQEQLLDVGPLKQQLAAMQADVNELTEAGRDEAARRKQLEVKLVEVDKGWHQQLEAKLASAEENWYQLSRESQASRRKADDDSRQFVRELSDELHKAIEEQREAVHELQEDVTDHQNALDTVMDLVEQSVTVDQASELVRDYCSSFLSGAEMSKVGQSGSTMEAVELLLDERDERVQTAVQELVDGQLAQMLEERELELKNSLQGKLNTMFTDMVDGLDVHVDTKQLDDNLQEACDELEERLRSEFESELNRLETAGSGQLVGPTGGPLEAKVGELRRELAGLREDVSSPWFEAEGSGGAAAQLEDRVVALEAAQQQLRDEQDNSRAALEAAQAEFVMICKAAEAEASKASRSVERQKQNFAAANQERDKFVNDKVDQMEARIGRIVGEKLGTGSAAPPSILGGQQTPPLPTPLPARNSNLEPRPTSSATLTIGQGSARENVERRAAERRARIESISKTRSGTSDVAGSSRKVAPARALSSNEDQAIDDAVERASSRTPPKAIPSRADQLEAAAAEASTKRTTALTRAQRLEMMAAKMEGIAAAPPTPERPAEYAAWGVMDQKRWDKAHY